MHESCQSKLFFAVLVLCSIGFAGCGFSPSPETAGEEITVEQNRILSHCEKQLLSGHPYFKSLDTKMEIERVKNTLTQSRDWWREAFLEVHWQNVVKNGEDTRGFMLLLDLKTEAIPKTGSTNSNTMPSTKILNHVFDGLRELGYDSQSRGPAGGMISRVQYAMNTWYLERNLGGRKDYVTVTGEVFLAPGDQQAIVQGTIRYELGK